MTLRELLVTADSVTSLVAHRHRSGVPEDVVDGLLAVSSECRKLSDDLPADVDALAVQIAEAKWPGRYVGDLTEAQWREVYDFLGITK